MVKDTVKVIVYGTLLTGERNAHHCRNALNVQPCRIVGTLYDTRNGYPAFVPDEFGGAVQAELVELPAEDLARLDWLEGYPSYYDRKKVEAYLPDGSIETGWVYVLNELPVLASVILYGDWKKYREDLRREGNAD